MTKRSIRAALTVGVFGLLGYIVGRSSRKGRGLSGLGATDVGAEVEVARDALQEGTPGSRARATKVLKLINAKRISDRKDRLAVAQCIRKVSRESSPVKQSLYRIYADPSAPNPKIHVPYVVVSASKSYGGGSVHAEGQTAIFEAGPDDINLEPRSGHGGNLFPIALNAHKELMWGDADSAEWRGIFSHKKALAKSGITHVIPCEGVELFGQK